MCFSPILLLYESLHHSPLASRPATFSFVLFRSDPIPDLAPKRVRVVALYVMGGRQRLLGGDAWTLKRVRVVALYAMGWGIAGASEKLKD